MHRETVFIILSKIFKLNLRMVLASGCSTFNAIDALHRKNVFTILSWFFLMLNLIQIITHISGSVLLSYSPLSEILFPFLPSLRHIMKPRQHHSYGFYGVLTLARLQIQKKKNFWYLRAFLQHFDCALYIFNDNYTNAFIVQRTGT